MLKGRLVSCLLLSLAGAAAFGQQAGASPTGQATAGSRDAASALVAGPGAAAEEASGERATLASTTPDYPVTPGDVYRLTYVSAAGAFALPVSVSSDTRVNLSIFGEIDARGLAFPELKARVEEKVLKVYPGSGPLLMLQAAGMFRVYLTGEVESSGWVSVWGLSRLSDIVTERLTPYSSIRTVEVASADGQRKHYDLFLASRSGRRDMDPPVRPGDTIVVRKRDREITVTGEVERPGSYQLLEGEELREAIQSYAEGFTKVADQARLEVTRWDTEGTGAGQTFYVDASSLEKPVALRDLDAVRVPSKKERLPVAYFEGAIAPTSESTDRDPQTFTRVAYTFVDGELLSSAAAALYERFGSGSDLEHAFLIRSAGGETIPVNIRELALGTGSAQDLPLRPYDRIVIPFRRYVVTVSGAVARPGQYPFTAGRSWRHYVDLAGGFDADRHAGETVEITDIRDGKRQPDQPIEAEDRIFAPSNNPLRVVLPLVQVTGALASVVAALLALAQFLR